MTIRFDDGLATEAVTAIQRGAVDDLRRLLAAHPELVTTRIVASNGCERSLLHIATDWPGHFPNVAETIAVLHGAGADVNAAFIGPHSETPLHWAASSNDLVAIDALLRAGAAIEATGAVIAGGTPLDDAVSFGQWDAARKLVECGARTSLWNAAALGLLDRVHALCAQDPGPSADQLTTALWYACHGGQRATAELLADRGADLDRLGHGDLTPLDAATHAGADDLVAWLRDRGASSAAELRSRERADRSNEPAVAESAHDDIPGSES